MKQKINNLLDKNEYIKQLKEREVDNTKYVARRINEILNIKLKDNSELFNIYVSDFDNREQFIIAEKILSENGWHVKRIFNQMKGDSIRVSPYPIV